MTEKHDETKIKNALRKYIAESLLFLNGDPSFGNDDSLVEQGVIDSTGVLELVLFVEETFGIEVRDADVLPENFDSIDKLTCYIVSRMETSGSEVGVRAGN